MKDMRAKTIEKIFKIYRKIGWKSKQKNGERNEGCPRRGWENQ